jgi:SPP1 family predicted phage head-tail adaptor
MKNRLESIEFFTSDDTTSNSGFITGVPVSYWLTRAEVKPLSDGGDPNSRRTEDYQTTLQTGFTFKIRYRSDKTVTKAMSLVYSGATYTIHGIQNVDEANKTLIVTGLGSA